MRTAAKTIEACARAREPPAETPSTGEAKCPSALLRECDDVLRIAVPVRMEPESGGLIFDPLGP